MRSWLRLPLLALAGTVIFAGLPILGWRSDAIAAFFDDPARRAYVLVVVLLQAVIVAWAPNQGQGSGVGTQFVARQRWAVVCLQVLSLSIVLASPYCDRRGLWVFPGGVQPRWLGLALLALGLLGMSWATAALGRQFSVQVTIQEDHRLITSGPYRFIRHPRYLGTLLLGLGIALVFRSWIGMLLTGALKLVLLWRIHDEEWLLAQTFGAEWEAYRRRTWRLVPGVF